MSEPAAVSEGLRERNKREKLERIRAAARELFAEKGFEATTAREVCQRAEIGNGTLFLYARDKRELLFLVIADEARERIRTALARATTRANVCGALATFFGAFLDAYAENPAFARVVAGEFFFRRDDTPAMVELKGDFFGGIAALVSQARERGELRDDVPVDEQVNAYFAHYSLHVQFWLAGAADDRTAVERSITRAFEWQTEGLAAGPSRSAAAPSRLARRVARRKSVR